jgi:hypothetical protein
MENPFKLYPKWFNPKNFRGVTIWPFGIYIRRYNYSDIKKLKNHELIHWRQQKEMLGIFFYIWYLIEWIVNIFIYKNKAYIKLSHEQEAYDNDKNLSYLKKRKPYSWIKYLKHKPVK